MQTIQKNLLPCPRPFFVDESPPAAEIGDLVAGGRLSLVGLRSDNANGEEVFGDGVEVGETLREQKDFYPRGAVVIDGGCGNGGGEGDAGVVVIPPYQIHIGDLVRHAESGTRGIIRYIGPMYKRSLMSRSPPSSPSRTQEGEQEHQEEPKTGGNSPFSRRVANTNLAGLRSGANVKASSPSTTSFPPTPVGVAAAAALLQTPTSSKTGEQKEEGKVGKREQDAPLWHFSIVSSSSGGGGGLRGGSANGPIIDPTPWFGIEWERPIGRNNGVIDGIHYFTPLTFAAGKQQREEHYAPSHEGTKKSISPSKNKSAATLEHNTSEKYYCSMARRNKFYVQKSLVGALINRYSTFGGGGAASTSSRTKFSGPDPFLRSADGAFVNVMHCDCTANESLKCIGFAEIVPSVSVFNERVKEGLHDDDENKHDEQQRLATLLIDGVAARAIPRHLSLSTLFPNLHTLSLNGTLLQSWRELWQVLSGLPRLTHLNAANLLLSTPLEIPELQALYGQWKDRRRLGGKEKKIILGDANSASSEQQLSQQPNALQEGASQHLLPPLFYLNISDTNLPSEVLLFLLAMFPTLAEIVVGNNTPAPLAKGLRRGAWKGWRGAAAAGGGGGRVVSPIFEPPNGAISQHDNAACETIVGNDSFLFLAEASPSFSCMSHATAVGSENIKGLVEAETREGPASKTKTSTTTAFSTFSLLNPMRLREAAERLAIGPAADDDKDAGFPRYGQLIIDAAWTLLFSIETLSINKLDLCGQRDAQKIERRWKKSSAIVGSTLPEPSNSAASVAAGGLCGDGFSVGGRGEGSSGPLSPPAATSTISTTAPSSTSESAVLDPDAPGRGILYLSSSPPSFSSAASPSTSLCAPPSSQNLGGGSNSNGNNVVVNANGHDDGQGPTHSVPFITDTSLTPLLISAQVLAKLADSLLRIMGSGQKGGEVTRKFPSLKHLHISECPISNLSYIRYGSRYVDGDGWVRPAWERSGGSHTYSKETERQAKEELVNNTNNEKVLLQHDGPFLTSSRLFLDGVKCLYARGCGAIRDWDETFSGLQGCAVDNKPEKKSKRGDTAAANSTSEVKEDSHDDTQEENRDGKSELDRDANALLMNVVSFPSLEDITFSHCPLLKLATEEILYNAHCAPSALAKMDPNDPSARAAFNTITKQEDPAAVRRIELLGMPKRLEKLNRSEVTAFERSGVERLALRLFGPRYSTEVVWPALVAVVDALIENCKEGRDENTIEGTASTCETSTAVPTGTATLGSSSSASAPLPSSLSPSAQRVMRRKEVRSDRLAVSKQVIGDFFVGGGSAKGPASRHQHHHHHTHSNHECDTSGHRHTTATDTKGADSDCGHTINSAFLKNHLSAWEELGINSRVGPLVLGLEEACCRAPLGIPKIALRFTRRLLNDGVDDLLESLAEGDAYAEMAKEERTEKKEKSRASVGGGGEEVKGDELNDLRRDREELLSRLYAHKKAIEEQIQEAVADNEKEEDDIRHPSGDVERTINNDEQDHHRETISSESAGTTNSRRDAHYNSSSMGVQRLLRYYQSHQTQRKLRLPVSAGVLPHSKIPLGSGCALLASSPLRTNATAAPNVVRPQYLQYSAHVQYLTLLVSPAELIALRTGGFISAIREHLRQAKLREVRRQRHREMQKQPSSSQEGGGADESDHQLHQPPTIGERRKGFDPMFETLVDLRWSVRDLRTHLGQLANLPSTDPLELVQQRQQQQQQQDTQSSPSSDFHRILNEEEHWSLCYMAFTTVRKRAEALLQKKMEGSRKRKGHEGNEAQVGVDMILLGLDEDWVGGGGDDENDDGLSIASKFSDPPITEAAREILTVAAEGFATASATQQRHQHNTCSSASSSAVITPVSPIPPHANPSDNPAGHKFPPLALLFPHDSVFLFHIDVELLANAGAVAKGVHCKDMLRPQDAVHGFRVHDGDLFIVAMVV